MIEAESSIMTMAVLPKDDARGKNWEELFLGPRVPIVTHYPQTAHLPDGRIEDCYFVDFKEAGLVLLDHLKMVNERRGMQNKAAVAGMPDNGIYPIIAENVTVVRGRREIWFN